MTTQVYYRKWRPQSLSEVVGQEATVRTLKNALTTGRVAHAYLFCGPRGTGKTSTARILAKAVNCLSRGSDGEPCNTCAMCTAFTEGRALDLVEIDAASNRGIDEIRGLREKVNFVPNEARSKVYIIDEVHMLTDAAFNALLKTLEEPPSHAIFVLATTEVHRVPATILSRCQRFDFRRIPQQALVACLAQICGKEGVTAEPAALEFIGKSATGSLRDAENLLEQLVVSYGSELQLHHVHALLGITGDPRSLEFVKHLAQKDLAKGLTTINQVSDDGLDLRQFSREVLEYLRSLLVLKAGASQILDLSAEVRVDLAALAARLSLEEVTRAVRLFGQMDFRQDGPSALPLELALAQWVMADGEKPAVEAGPAGEVGSPGPSKGSPRTESAQRTGQSSPREVASTVSRPQGPPPVPPLRSEMPRPPPARAGLAPGAPARPARAPLPARLEGQPSVQASVPEQAADSFDKAQDNGPAASPEAAAVLERVRERWGQIIEASRGVGKRVALDALLRNSCQPVDIEGDVVVLGFYYPFHKEKIEDPVNRRLVEEVLSNVLDARYRVRCVLTQRQNRAQGPSRPQGHLVDAALRMGARLLEEREEKE